MKERMRYNSSLKVAVVPTLALIIAIGAAFQGCGTKGRANEAEVAEGNQHVKVFYEEGKYGGWPANWGVWHWGNEILVGFVVADHEDKQGHTYNKATALGKYARSLDGGLTWSLEDAFANGITESGLEHNIGDASKEATALEEPIDFQHEDFAFTFRAKGFLEGPTSFYYSYNRGKTWHGAYKLSVDFPGPKPVGIVSRTDYIIDGKHEMTAFLTVAFEDGDKDWRQTACVRTTDGGMTWQHVGWIGPPEISSIMPSSVRLGPSKIITVIRRTKPPDMVAFLSEDNGATWTQMPDPAIADRNPPALMKLDDGRLCLVYGVRDVQTLPDGTGVYVTYSGDEGRSWSTPVLVRGKDGSSNDMGYPRVVQRPDGKVVAIYYYNHAKRGDKYRYIAASIFDPTPGNKVN